MFGSVVVAVFVLIGKIVVDVVVGADVASVVLIVVFEVGRVDVVFNVIIVLGSE